MSKLAPHGKSPNLQKACEDDHGLPDDAAACFRYG